MRRIVAKSCEACLTIAVAASVLPTNAERLIGKLQVYEDSTITVHDVHLLVTRHGLSCTNIVEKWISWYDFGRGDMHDPLLGGIGEFGSRESGKQAAMWLKDKNYTLDAVLSSDLERAIETALLMYPQGPVPLYVVPYIREHASGLSNTPKSSNSQMRDLTRAVKQDFWINYEWTNIFGHEKAEWSDFMTFLEHSFLPTLIKKQGKPPGSPIVLAVTTHSLFMKKALDSKCGRFWRSKKASKPLNNQVLHVSYDFHISRPGISSLDVTPKHSLKPSSFPCEEAASGMQLTDKQGYLPTPICLSDIGAECLDSIKLHALQATVLWKKTTEYEIIKLAKDCTKIREKLPTLSRELESLSAKSMEKEKDRIKVLEQMEQKKEDISTVIASSMTCLKKLSAMQQQKCWTGGTPDVQWYRNFLKPDLSPDVIEAIQNTEHLDTDSWDDQSLK